MIDPGPLPAPPIDKLSDDKLTRVGSDVPYSLIVQDPSPDLAGYPEYKDGPTQYVKASARELHHFRGSVLIPQSVYDFMEACVRRGCYRVEIIAGQVSYKLYVKPPAENAAEVMGFKLTDDYKEFLTLSALEFRDATQENRFRDLQIKFPL
jgi:hypothetical protein